MKRLIPEKHKLYLDQMLQERVAEALREEGYDVVRASETGDARADDYQILQKAIFDNRTENSIMSPFSLDKRTYILQQLSVLEKHKDKIHKYYIETLKDIVYLRYYAPLMDIEHEIPEMTL